MSGEALASIASVLLGIAMLVSVAWAIWHYRAQISELGRAEDNRRRVFSAIGRLKERTTHPLAEGGDGVLDGPEFQTALSELTTLARDLKPDWIFGLHVGGRLLSVLVANAIGVAPERCVYVSTSADQSRRLGFGEPPAFEIHGRPNRISGKVLVLDDVSRTGGTLRAFRSFLEANNFQEGFDLDRVTFAVLAVYADDDSPRRFRPDWSKFRTGQYRLKLPWSRLSAEVESAFTCRTEGYSFQEQFIRLHQRIVEDFSYALELASQYVGGRDPLNDPGFLHEVGMSMGPYRVLA